jgi:hypothetical protein
MDDPDQCRMDIACAVDLGPCPLSRQPSCPSYRIIQPPWSPQLHARASRRRRPLPTAPGSASAHRSPLDAQLRGARPPRTATTTASSVSLVACVSGFARRSLPCPPPDIGFPRKTHLHRLLKVFLVWLTNLPRCLALDGE